MAAMAKGCRGIRGMVGEGADGSTYPGTLRPPAYVCTKKVRTGGEGGERKGREGKGPPSEMCALSNAVWLEPRDHDVLISSQCVYINTRVPPLPLARSRLTPRKSRSPRVQGELRPVTGLGKAGGSGGWREEARLDRLVSTVSVLSERLRERCRRTVELRLCPPKVPFCSRRC